MKITVVPMVILGLAVMFPKLEEWLHQIPGITSKIRLEEYSTGNHNNTVQDPQASRPLLGDCRLKEQQNTLQRRVGDLKNKSIFNYFYFLLCYYLNRLVYICSLL